MSARSIASRIPTIAVCVLLCLVMFDVPSAYAIARGAPWWLALVVGVVVFPLAPVAWHVMGERKRKRADAAKASKPGAMPSKPGMRGIERFVLRTVVIGVIAIGGLIVVARERVWSAFRSHASWFIPTTIERLDPSSKLLDKVPPSAQIVLWVRPTADANAVVGQVVPGTEVTEIVIGIRGDAKAAEGVVIERGDLIIPLIERIQAMVLAFTAKSGISLPAKGSVIGEADGVKTWSTNGWASELGTGRAPVIELMRRAPEDAFVVAVAKLVPPATPSETSKPDSVDALLGAGVTAVIWVRAPHETLELDMTIETPDEATATKLLAEADKEIAKTTVKEAKNVACWKTHTDELFFRREGSKLRARMSIDVTGLKALMACFDK